MLINLKKKKYQNKVFGGNVGTKNNVLKFRF